MRQKKNKKLYRNFQNQLNEIVNKRYNRRSEFASEYYDKYGIDISEAMKNWFAGRSMPDDVSVLYNICDLLNCDIDYLVGKQNEFRKATAEIAGQLGLKYESTEKIEKYPSEIKELLDRVILNQTGDNLLKLLKSIHNYAVYGHNVFLELYDVSIDSRNTELEDEFEIPVIDKEQSKEVLKRASTGVMRQVLDDAYDNYIPDSNLRLKERLSMRCKKEKEQFLNLSKCSQVSSLSKEEQIKLGEWTNWGELSNDEALKKIEQKYQSRYKMYVETVPKKKKKK